MNIFDLTTNQLKRAAAIKEQIEDLSHELRSILGASVTSGAATKKTRMMSASAKKAIAAAQKARWAKIRGAKAATFSTKPAAKAKKKKTMSRAVKAKLSTKLKAYWAARKAGKK